MKRLDPGLFQTLLDAVTVDARRHGIGGFIIVADLVTSTAMFALVNTDTPLRIGVPDKNDANFAAIAGAKFGKVFAHKANSGGKTTIVGEQPFMGGRLSQDGEFVYAFSGAPEEVDDELMQIAEKLHQQFS